MFRSSYPQCRPLLPERDTPNVTSHQAFISKINKTVCTCAAIFAYQYGEPVKSSPPVYGAFSCRSVFDFLCCGLYHNIYLLFVWFFFLLFWHSDISLISTCEFACFFGTMYLILTKVKTTIKTNLVENYINNWFDLRFRKVERSSDYTHNVLCKTIT